MNKKGLEIPLANGFDDVTMVVFDGPARKTAVDTFQSWVTEEWAVLLFTAAAAS